MKKQIRSLFGDITRSKAGGIGTRTLTIVGKLTISSPVAAYEPQAAEIGHLIVCAFFVNLYLLFEFPFYIAIHACNIASSLYNQGSCRMLHRSELAMLTQARMKRQLASMCNLAFINKPTSGALMLMVTLSFGYQLSKRKVMMCYLF